MFRVSGKHTAGRRGGFTLIELMVAMAILGLGLTAVYPENVRQDAEGALL
jgi:prepilin-type N-terminal cleavage/methylation domain-containing protein